MWCYRTHEAHESHEHIDAKLFHTLFVYFEFVSFRILLTRLHVYFKLYLSTRCVQKEN